VIGYCQQGGRVVWAQYSSRTIHGLSTERHGLIGPAPPGQGEDQVGGGGEGGRVVGTHGPGRPLQDVLAQFTRSATLPRPGGNENEFSRQPQGIDVIKTDNLPPALE
jgi:hypothetical protein